MAGHGMRKQYYFRNSKQGLLAWDVDRLIELTAELTPESIRLSEIRELDESHWFNGVDSRPTCRKIATHIQLTNNADLAYPIILSSDGRVMDGMHRVVKAYLQGQTSIQAVCLPEPVAPDFVGVSEDDLPYERIN